MQNMRKALQETWRQLKDKPIDELLEARFEKLIGYGKFKEAQHSKSAVRAAQELGQRIACAARRDGAARRASRRP